MANSPTMEEARELNEQLAVKLRLIEEQTRLIQQLNQEKSNLQVNVRELRDTITHLSDNTSASEQVDPLRQNEAPSETNPPVGRATDDLFRTLLSEFNNLKSELNQIRMSNNTNNAYPNGPEAPSINLTPKITMRDALAYIPKFDGSNMSVSQFIRACQRALNILGPLNQRTFLELLRGKFDGIARTVVDNLDYQSISELESSLRDMFDPLCTASQYKAALQNIVINTNEHIASYINRVQTLYLDIINAETRECQEISNFEKFRIETDAIDAFLRGLPLPLRMQCMCQSRDTLPQVYKAATEAYKLFLRDSKRFKTNQTSFVGLTQVADTSQDVETLLTQNDTQVNSNQNQSTQANASSNQSNNNSRQFDNNRNNGYRNNYPRNFYNNNNRNYNQRNFNRDNRPRYYNNQSGGPNNFNRNNNNNSDENFQFDRNKFCDFCNRPGHDLTDCRRLKFLNDKRDSIINSKNEVHPEARSDGTPGSSTKKTPPNNTKQQTSTSTNPIPSTSQTVN